MAVITHEYLPKDLPMLADRLDSGSFYDIRQWANGFGENKPIVLLKLIRTIEQVSLAIGQEPESIRRRIVLKLRAMTEYAAKVRKWEEEHGQGEYQKRMAEELRKAVGTALGRISRQNAPESIAS